MNDLQALQTRLTELGWQYAPHGGWYDNGEYLISVLDSHGMSVGIAKNVGFGCWKHELDQINRMVGR